MARDNRNEIIRTQLEVISELINNNMRNIGSDFFGTPASKPTAPANKQPEKPVQKPETSATKAGNRQRRRLQRNLRRI